MKYLIVQDWNNTHGNHAGMVHMCKLLKEKYPDGYQVFVKPEPKEFPYKRNLLGQLKRVWNHFVSKPIYYNKTYPRELQKLCQPMFYQLQDGDEVFLLEYLSPGTPQIQLAKYIRENYPNVRIFALSHLTKLFFEKYIIPKDRHIIEKWAEPVDKMLTLGSSLSKYFVVHGVPSDKISTGFHYVDTDYYHKKETLTVHNPIRVIAMGNLQRDYSLLSEVVKGTPNVHYTICHGRTPVDGLFDRCNNVDLKGYLSEDDLRRQMDIADVSINIMEDTVGSNVITTSLAMGLAMVVSDVGSIRDYCSEDNAVFADNTTGSFISAIKQLEQNPQIILEMRKASIEHSKDLNISKVHEWFNELSNDINANSHMPQTGGGYK